MGTELTTGTGYSRMRLSQFLDGGNMANRKIKGSYTRKTKQEFSPKYIAYKAWVAAGRPGGKFVYSGK